MIQFVLQQHVDVAARDATSETEIEIVKQASGIGSIGLRKNSDVVTAVTEIFNQLPVIQVSPGRALEITVHDETNAHVDNRVVGSTGEKAG